MHICAIWGVPKSKIENKYQNRDTARVTEDVFRLETIEPLIVDYEQTLTNHFRQWDEKILFSHEPYVIRDPEMELKRNEFYLRYGVKSRNEIRQVIGMETIEDGDIYLVPDDLTTMPALLAKADLIEAEIQAVEDTPTTEVIVEEDMKFFKSNIIDVSGYLDTPFKDIPESVKLAFWLKYDALNSKEENDLRLSIVDVFKGLNKVINHNIETAFGESKSKINKVGVAADLELFDMKVWGKVIDEKCSPKVAKIIKKVLKSSMGDIGEPYVEGDFSSDIKKITRKSTAKIKVGLTTIDKDLRKMIVDVIESNPLASSKELMDKIIKKVDGKFTNTFNKSRAKMISETTTTFSNGASQETAWKKVGLNMSWLSRRDKNVRDAHRKADGQIRAKDGMFYVGAEYMPFPASGMIASNNVNCRCYMFPTNF